MRASWFLLLAACGRVGFTPLGPPTGDDDMPPDGAMTDGTIVDAPALASSCTAPIVPQVGVLIEGSTCTGLNLIDICTSGVEEHVFAFTAPVSGNFEFSVPVGFEIELTDAGCVQSNVCTAQLTISLAAGETLTLVVEPSDGAGCRPFTFLVKQV